MSRQIVIPFGPQHPVLPEPIHLDLVMEDERVVDALPSIGYVHRGLEKLVEKRELQGLRLYRRADLRDLLRSSTASTYCQAVEGDHGARRAAAGRSTSGRSGPRLSRLHSHLLWLGSSGRLHGLRDRSSCSPGASASTSSTTWSRTTGNRVIQGVVQGRRGPARRLEREARRLIVATASTRCRQLDDLVNVFVRDDYGEAPARRPGRSSPSSRPGSSGPSGPCSGRAG